MKLHLRSAATILLGLLVLCSCSEDAAPTKPAAPVRLLLEPAAGVGSLGLAGEISDLVVADVTGDGLVDLAVGMVDSAKVWLRVGLGGGALAPAVAVIAGTTPTSIGVANLAGNSRNDLVVGGDSTVVIIESLPGGGFGAPDTLVTIPGATIRAVATADFDRDGVADVEALFTQSGVNWLGIFSGQSHALLGQPTATIGTLLTTGDFTGEGDADFATIDRTPPGFMTVLEGHRTSLQPYAYYFEDASTSWLGSAKTGAAGESHLFVAHPTPPGLWQMTYGASGVALQDSTLLPATPASFVVGGDLTLDGREDVATVSTTTDKVAVFVNQGDGTLQDAQLFPSGGGANRMAIADLDGDGKRDVILAGPASADGIRWMRNMSH